MNLRLIFGQGVRFGDQGSEWKKNMKSEEVVQGVMADLLLISAVENGIECTDAIVISYR